MTIEEVMNGPVRGLEVVSNVYDEDNEESCLEVEEARAELRAALTALVAQARDEEAAACIGIIVGANNYDNPLTGNDCIDMIRARIAARAEEISHG